MLLFAQDRFQQMAYNLWWFGLLRSESLPWPLVYYLSSLLRLSHVLLGLQAHPTVNDRTMASVFSMSMFVRLTMKKGGGERGPGSEEDTGSGFYIQIARMPLLDIFHSQMQECRLKILHQAHIQKAIRVCGWPL